MTKVDSLESKANTSSEAVNLKTKFIEVNEQGLLIAHHSKSESSKNAAKLSFGRMAQRTDDLDISVSKDCWDNQRKAIDDFREDKYNTLEEA